MAYVLDDGTRSLGVLLRQARSDLLAAALSEPATPAVSKQLRQVLGLDLDGAGCVRLGERDPALAALQQRARGARPAALVEFEAVAAPITQQAPSR
jgi:hypothetical protein